MTSENSEVLEYLALKEILAQFTTSTAGARLVEELAPFSQRIEIQKQFEILAECFQLLRLNKKPPFDGLKEFSSLFAKLEIEGVTLAPQEILQVLQLTQSVMPRNYLTC
jgi:dsDNA-specific endonuclease/ATPase MutS2